MASPSQHQGDLYVVGELGCRVFNPPSNCIGDTAFRSDSPLSHNKQEHGRVITYAQESAASAADESRVLLTVSGGAGTVLLFEAGNVVANIGNAKVEVDLLKNGVSILTGHIDLTSACVAYDTVEAVINIATLVDGDILEAKIDGTIGTGTLAKGVFCSLKVKEDAQ